MIKVYEVISNFYKANEDGEASECCLPTRYHGLFLTKRGAIKKLNTLIKVLGGCDLRSRFMGSHDHMVILPLDDDFCTIENWPDEKDKLRFWVRYHIDVLDITDKDYLEELK